MEQSKVRIDSAAFPGCTIAPDYDSLIAKLIVRGRDRGETLQRLARALDEYRIAGVPTTLPLLRALVDFAPVVDATYGTATLEPFAAGLAPASADDDGPAGGAPETADTQTLRVEVDGRLFRVRFVDLPAGIQARAGASNGTKSIVRPNAARRSAAPSGNEIRSPMHGVVVEVPVREGDAVAAGDVVMIVEAMKMMNEIRAHKAGRIVRVHAAAGTTVEAHAPLITLQ